MHRVLSGLGLAMAVACGSSDSEPEPQKTEPTCEEICRAEGKLCEDGASDSLYFQTVQRWVADPETLDAVLRKKLPG